MIAYVIGISVLMIILIIAAYVYMYGNPFEQTGSDPRMKRGPCASGQWQYGEKTTGPWCCSVEPTNWSDKTGQYENCGKGGQVCYAGKGTVPAGYKKCP